MTDSIIHNMGELVKTLEECLKFAEENECECHYDKSCVVKTVLRQNIEKTIEFCKTEYPRTMEMFNK